MVTMSCELQRPTPGDGYHHERWTLGEATLSEADKCCGDPGEGSSSWALDFVGPELGGDLTGMAVRTLALYGFSSTFLIWVTVHNFLVFFLKK